MFSSSFGAHSFIMRRFGTAVKYQAWALVLLERGRGEQQEVVQGGRQEMARKCAALKKETTKVRTIVVSGECKE